MKKTLLLPLYSFVGLAAAYFPRLDVSSSFTLIFNVTIPTTMLEDHTINGLSLSALHLGTGFDVPSVGSTPLELVYGNDMLMTGIGSITGEALGYYPEPDPTYLDLLFSQQYAAYDFGVPTPNNAPSPGCLAAFAPLDGTFAVCDTGSANESGVPPYELLFVLPNYTRSETVFSDPSYGIPPNCVGVTLLPQCGNDLYAGRPDVDEILCYENVTNIDWSGLNC